MGRLRIAGVVLAVRGDRLVVDAPVGAVTPALKAELAERKSELVRLLGREASRRADLADPAWQAQCDRLIAKMQDRVLEGRDLAVLAFQRQEREQEDAGFPFGLNAAPGADLPPEPRPFALANGSGTVSYRAHLARIRRIAAERAASTEARA